MTVDEVLDDINERIDRAVALLTDLAIQSFDQRDAVRDLLRAEHKAATKGDTCRSGRTEP